MTFLAMLLALSGASLASDFMASPAATQEFLPVEQAFELQPVETRKDMVIVTWRIAPGYFLYRARLGFVSASPGLKLGKPKLPKGRPHHDELLGDTEIYGSDLRVKLPASGSGTLKLTYQGCAEKGLCYPPQTRELTVNLAAAK